MGSCISKCKTKKTHNKEKQQKCQSIEKNTTTPLVEDKLVISQAPISTPLPSKHSLVSPLSPSNSSPPPSFSCNKSTYPPTSSSSSSSSCSSLSSASSFASSTSSSILSSKSDGSFSNDFLWSCVKENPQLIRPNYAIKVANPKTRPSPPTRCYTNSGNKSFGPKQQPPSPSRATRPTPQKRARSSSPSNLTRQKSFRREPEKPVLSNNRESRPVSPSPSRRFKGEVVTTSMRRDNYYVNVRPHSPKNVASRKYNNSGRFNNSLAKRDYEDIKRVESKIKELPIGALTSCQDMEWLPVEDANNPHIALDCFIFL